MNPQRSLNWTNALRGMHADRTVTVEQRRAACTAASAIKLATDSAKRFASTTAPLVRRDGTFDRSAVMTAATRSAQARMEVTGDAWGVCMAFALKGAWAAAKSSRFYRAH